MANLAALYDASVLYPAPLRDLLMQLALSDLYRAHRTNDIHDEWIRNVLGNRPDLAPEQLDRTRALMNASVRDCLVENYRELIPALDLPDLDDRHVLAAAIVANADVIVTFNLRDFPRENLEILRNRSPASGRVHCAFDRVGAIKGHLGGFLRSSPTAESTAVGWRVHQHYRATAITEFCSSAAKF